MSMEWYRAYHGMPHDPKLQVVAKRSKQPMAFVVAVWVYILDAASQHDPRGMVEIDPEEVAVIQDIDLEVVETILDVLTSKKLIDDEGNVVNWHKRQHTTSTERSKKSREKKKRDAAASNSKQCRATTHSAERRKKGKKHPDTDKDTEADLDTDQITHTDLKNRAREEKRESQGEKQQISGKGTEQNKTQILQQMADIWNEKVQSKITPSQNVILTPKRKELLAARWVDEFAEDIRGWRYFCEVIGTSDFCLGRIKGKDWTIDLTWAIQSPDRVAKILEGGFSGGKHPPKPPSCTIPEFQDAWDEVIKRMVHHHGSAAIRSWFTSTVITTPIDTPDGVMLTLECPREFVCGWIEEHYLNDLNFYWSEQSQISHTVVGIQLAVRGSRT